MIKTALMNDLDREMLKVIQSKKAKCLPKQISKNIEKKLKKALNIDTKMV